LTNSGLQPGEGVGFAALRRTCWSSSEHTSTKSCPEGRHKFLDRHHAEISSSSGTSPWRRYSFDGL